MQKSISYPLILAIFPCLLFLDSCSKGSQSTPNTYQGTQTLANTNQTTSSTTTNTVSATPTPTIPVITMYPATYGDSTGSTSNFCTSPGIGNEYQHIDYIRIPISAHGVIPDPGIHYIWTTSTGYTGSQNNLITDTRLNVRVYVKPISDYFTCAIDTSKYPGQKNDTRGYSKLNISLALIDPNNPTTPFEVIQFKDVAVNQCSPVKAFSSIPVTNSPLILWITQIQSDTECLSGRTGYCPYSFVPEKSCWNIELQISTDETKDIPR